MSKKIGIGQEFEIVALVDKKHTRQLSSKLRSMRIEFDNFDSKKSINLDKFIITTTFEHSTEIWKAVNELGKS